MTTKTNLITLQTITIEKSCSLNSGLNFTGVPKDFVIRLSGVGIAYLNSKGKSRMGLLAVDLGSNFLTLTNSLMTNLYLS